MSADASMTWAVYVFLQVLLGLIVACLLYWLPAGLIPEAKSGSKRFKWGVLGHWFFSVGCFGMILVAATMPIYGFLFWLLTVLRLPIPQFRIAVLHVWVILPVAGTTIWIGLLLRLVAGKGPVRKHELRWPWARQHPQQIMRSIGARARKSEPASVRQVRPRPFRGYVRLLIGAPLILLGVFFFGIGLIVAIALADLNGGSGILIAAGLLVVPLVAALLGAKMLRADREETRLRQLEATYGKEEALLIVQKSRMDIYSDEAHDDIKGAADKLRTQLRGREDVALVECTERFGELVVTVWFYPDATFAPETLPKSIDGWRVYPLCTTDSRAGFLKR